MLWENFHPHGRCRPDLRNVCDATGKYFVINEAMRRGGDGKNRIQNWESAYAGSGAGRRHGKMPNRG